MSGVLEKREEFLAEYGSGEWTMSELCRIYGISRPTGYAALRRYAAGGRDGLRERSRAPLVHSGQTPAEIEALVLELRRGHPMWGPRTLKKILEDRHDELRIPAASTIGAMLDREGLTHRRKKRRRVAPYTQPFAAAEEPNDEWSGDFRAGCAAAMEGASIR